MIKICSLDYVNKEKFDADILTADGRVLCSKGDKVTPDLLLRLYFKEIYIESTSVEEPEEEIYEDEDEDVSDSAAFEEDAPEEVKKAEERVAEIFKTQTEVEKDLDENLEFDEEEAVKIQDYASKIGKMLGFSEEKLKNLELAAFNCKIGRSRLTKGDLKRKDYIHKLAEESYNIMLNEQKLPEVVVEVAKRYIEKYNPMAFNMGDEIPFFHIVAIADYYQSMLSKGHQKNDVLQKMLQLGGNKFNIYVLHKFIRMMREIDE